MAKQYKSGMRLTHLETKTQILFGKWNADGSAGCIGPHNSFLTLTREELETQYMSESDFLKRAQEKRRGQGW